MIQNVHLWSHPFCIWTKALILSFTLSITGDCAFLSSKISETATIFLFSKFSDNSLYILLSSFSRLPISALTSSISLNSSLCIWAAQPVNTILLYLSDFDYNINYFILKYRVGTFQRIRPGKFPNINELIIISDPRGIFFNKK